MSDQHLILATYGCPSQPVEYYQILKKFLEQRTGFNIDLLYETDRLGPSVERGDQNHIDLAFVSTRYGLDLCSNQPGPPYTTLPIGAITEHPEDPQQTTVGYYSVVVVRRDKCDSNLKSFLDLRGSKLAYSDERSFSGMTALLGKLHQAGENASFFVTRQKCGSHLSCLDALLNRELEVCCVDSLALQTHRHLHPRLTDTLRHVFTWGPHPPHPLLARTGLDDDKRSRILAALQELRPDTLDPVAKEVLPLLQPYGVRGFGVPDSDIQADALALVEDCKKLSVDVAYY